FALCVWSTKFHPAAAFYLLPQRAWELFAGGIVSLQFRNNQWRRPWVLLSSGVLLIGISIIYYNKFSDLPSYSALLPVLGTSLVIAANRADASLFQNWIIQTIGKWSYSIYLWHWPVAVGAVYVDLDDFEIYNPRSFKIACEILVTIGIVAAGGLLSSLA